MDCSMLAYLSMEFSPGKKTGVGCHSPPPGIFPAQGLNLCLLWLLELQDSLLLSHQAQSSALI